MLSRPASNIVYGIGAQVAMLDAGRSVGCFDNILLCLGGSSPWKDKAKRKGKKERKEEKENMLTEGSYQRNCQLSLFFFLVCLRSEAIVPRDI